MRIKTGSGTSIGLLTLCAIYSVSVVISLPGLAISPILGELEHVFPHATQFQLQLLATISSLVVIPFILLSGRLSINRDRKTILIIGLGLFLLSSILYLRADSIESLLWISVLLGVGAGMIIPLSKGLIAIYFSGEQRQRQLGISSGVTNTSLVLATIITGELADIDWHWAFLVYMFSLVSLVLIFTLKPNREPQLPNETLDRIKSETPTPIPHDSIRESTQATAQSTHFRIPWALMWFYFTLCVMVLAIPIELSLFLEQLKIGTSADSGTLIAAFFLAITIPGFTLSYFIKWLGKWINIISTLMIVVGIGIFLISHNLWALAAGAILSGFGYGIMQPMVYEKAVQGVSKHRATYSLSWVMTMNYLSIIFYPVALKWIDNIFTTQSVYIPFIFSFIISAVMLILTIVRHNHRIVGTANSVQ